MLKDLAAPIQLTPMVSLADISDFGARRPRSRVASPHHPELWLRIRDLNPGLGSFPNLTPEAWSRFNSMLVTVNKRFSNHFQLTGSYTWSRCIDNGSYLGSFNTNSTGNFTDPYQLNIDKGVCSFDQTHVFKVNGLYQLPFHGNRFVEGWQISGLLTANSGLPFNIADGYDEATGGGVVALTPRPNYVSGCQVQVGQGERMVQSGLLHPRSSRHAGQPRQRHGKRTKIRGHGLCRAEEHQAGREREPAIPGRVFQHFQSHQSWDCRSRGLGGSALFAECGGKIASDRRVKLLAW